MSLSFSHPTPLFNQREPPKTNKHRHNWMVVNEKNTNAAFQPATQRKQCVVYNDPLFFSFLLTFYEFFFNDCSRSCVVFCTCHQFFFVMYRNWLARFFFVSWDYEAGLFIETPSRPSLSRSTYANNTPIASSLLTKPRRGIN